MKPRAVLVAALVVLMAVSLPALAQDTAPLEFQPKVGAIGARVTLKARLPGDARVKFGGRVVPVLTEADGTVSFMVPVGSASAFVEVDVKGKTAYRSAVPFVVTGLSLVSAPKLIGLREAIDVFGYAEPVPTGGEKPDRVARPVLSLDDQAILTIGEPPLTWLRPAVELGDLASAAKGPLGQAGFVITARPPKKKLTPAPPETAPPD